MKHKSPVIFTMIYLTRPTPGATIDAKIVLLQAQIFEKGIFRLVDQIRLINCSRCKTALQGLLDSLQGSQDRGESSALCYSQHLEVFLSQADDFRGTPKLRGFEMLLGQLYRGPGTEGNTRHVSAAITDTGNPKQNLSEIFKRFRKMILKKNSNHRSH